MQNKLNDREVRVLGYLMEKSMATPDYYPLSLNALTNACNQKSNRDPVVDWDEETIQDAVDALCKKNLASYKKPASVDFVDTLPMTPSGKILKREVMEQYWRGYEKRVH